jgi:hypothetical protein
VRLPCMNPPLLGGSQVGLHSLGVRHHEQDCPEIGEIGITNSQRAALTLAPAREREAELSQAPPFLEPNRQPWD